MPFALKLFCHLFSHRLLSLGQPGSTRPLTSWLVMIYLALAAGRALTTSLNRPIWVDIYDKNVTQQLTVDRDQLLAGLRQ